MNKLILAAGLATALFLALQGASVGREPDAPSIASATTVSGFVSALDRLSLPRF